MRVRSVIALSVGLVGCLFVTLATETFAQHNPQLLAVRAPRAQPIPTKPAGQDEAEREARINGWTVGLAGGLLEGSFVRYAADLAKVLDDGDNLRVLPIVSYGAVANVTDLIYLKGVDFAITNADVLEYYRTVDKIPNIGDRINYVIPLFQSEVHIYARPEIKTVEDLRGKKVNFNTVGSAANYTGGIVFDQLGIKVERTFLNNSVALESMKAGEISAIVHVVAKPNELFMQQISGSGFHFLPVEFGERFKDYYIPAELTAVDYPQILAKGETIPTISVPALLAVYNWREDTDRFRRCRRFVEYLFQRFDKLRERPYQSGWREVNLSGTVPGWTRFAPFQTLLDNAAARTKARPLAIDPDLARAQAARVAPADVAQQERLFEDFLRWSKQQNH